MPFTVAGFNQELALDNPTYERVLRSDLHALVTALRQVPATWTLLTLSVAMKTISAVKWTKYGRTRRYLEAQIPGLTALLRAVPSGFMTIAMTSQLSNTILRHTFRWTSDTGNVPDLALAVTRERVTWPQWPAALTACIGLPHGAAYIGPGHHVGLANNPATLAMGQDDHALMGPFNGAILNYAGGPVSAHMDQVYEYSYDRVNWMPIPNSNFTIVRHVTGLAGGHVRLSITKTNVHKPADTFVVQRTF